LTIPGFSPAAQRLPRLLGVSLLAASLPAACVRRLPPSPTPAALAPALDTSTPAPVEGTGRLVVDVVDGPTPVQRIDMKAQRVDDGKGRARFRFAESAQLLCRASPCVTDLPVGNVLLAFPVIGDQDALDVELVHVDPEIDVYRRALSVREDHSGATRVLGIVGASIGAASAITGMALLPIGLSDGNDDLATAGGITLGVGVALVALGAWAIWHDAPTYRPGAANHFPLRAADPGGR
jgi:hypothetical protein